MRLSCILPFAALGIALNVPADSHAYHHDRYYEFAFYGRHPLQSFKSAADLEVPKLDILQWDEACASSLYTLFTPRGAATVEPQATILDDDGGLVWSTGWRGQQLYDLMVQEYKGEQYLTFWAGNDAVGGHGAGNMYMLDKHYKLFKEIGAANGLDADLHDFRLTEAGTALITVYEVVQADLSELGKGVGPIWDCLIQEIDLETGEALFQWRATDYWKASDSYKDIGGDGEGDDGRAYDFFHINSVDKDSRGNYLVSARFTCSLTYIDGASGAVIWVLGGKRNMFRDLSGGRATDMAYQHDARWSDGETTITVFDNAVDDAHPKRADTRGLRIAVDGDAMTAAVVAEYLSPRGVRGVSQGSLQTLANGNVLLGYGNAAAYTEFARDGRPLCDAHFAPGSRFGTGDVQSYRVYKYEWHGWPTATRPAAAIQRSVGRGSSRWSCFASWNGATEISSWVLQGSETRDGAAEEDWTAQKMVSKLGFETAIELNGSHPAYLRVEALDADGNRLGVSEPLDYGSLRDLPWITQTFGFVVDEDWRARAFVAFCGIGGLALVLWALSRWRSNGSTLGWRYRELHVD